jgi:CubicO group peptidase (beta-lactamase class C family)
MKTTLLIAFNIIISIANTLNCFSQKQSEKETKVLSLMPKVEALMQDFQVKNNLPSIAFGLVVDGKLIYDNYSGKINLKTGQIANNQSVYRIASMTKSFTALAILQLRDAGKLELDDPLSKYIIEMRGQKASKDAPEITIRHLLTHAAGFPEDNPWGDRQLAITDATMLKMIKKGLSFSNDPGISYEYSNMGFAMLGYIIKKVSGQPYQNYIANNIWKPLGMLNTFWEYAKVPSSQLALGYRWLEGQQVEQPMLGDGAYGAMGGMLTTIDDFAKYMRLHQFAYSTTIQNAEIIKKSSIKEMHQPWNLSALNTNTGCPSVSAYGYGLRFVRDCQKKTGIGHTGGLPGFGSNWKILTEYGIGIATFANGTYAPTSALNTQVLDMLVSEAGLQPKVFPISTILNKRKNELLALLPQWENAEKSGIFAENFFLDYFPELLKKEAESIFEKAGPILKVNEIIPENNLRGTFALEGKNQDIEVRFTLSPENPALIQEYSILLKQK